MKYDKSFKLEALKLSDEIGVRKASEQLGIPYYTLADWRTIRKSEGKSAFVGSGNRKEPLDLNIRKGPGTDYGRVQFCPVGVYTIMEVKAGQGSSAGWGKLKSGIGWISLDFCQKV